MEIQEIANYKNLGSLYNVELIGESRVKLHRGFPKKGKITGYEPNIYESVAESMRLFILNPCLLHIIAPERCEYIVKSGLKPVVTEDWDKVLENAPAEYSRQILKNYLGFHC